MDKIFEQNIIEQDSILCKIHPEILKIISEILPPNDVVHLSHTCKELHQKLPFYLKKSGTFTLVTSKVHPWFEGPACNFSISEINISFRDTNSRDWMEIAVWIQIIRSGIVVLETQKYFSEDREGKYQIKIKSATIEECKGGDRLRFMVYMDQLTFPVCIREVECSFQLALRLENYKYGKPIYITKKLKGYADFKCPFVSIVIEDAPGSNYPPCKDLHLGLHVLLKYHSKGNTNF